MNKPEELMLNGFRHRLPWLMPPEDGLEYVDINNPCVRVETVATTIKDFADEEFLFEMDVPQSSLSRALEEEKGVPMYKAYSMDMKNIMRRLFHSAVDNSGRILRVDDQLILDVADKLRRIVLVPKNANKGSGLIFRMVPAIALDRYQGAVVAFGLGQLVIRKKDDRKKRMLFKGYARDIHTQQILIKSVSQSLLTPIVVHN